MTLIGLAGFKGTGKSTIASHLVERHGFVRLPLAQILKDMLRTFGLSEAQIAGDLKEEPDNGILLGKTPRWAMQSLGTEWGRECIGQQVWVSAWWNKAQPILDLGGRVVCDDVRFLNEFEFINSKDGHVVEVIRPGYGGSDHASEQLPFEPVNSITNYSTEGYLLENFDEFLSEFE